MAAWRSGPAYPGADRLSRVPPGGSRRLHPPGRAQWPDGSHRGRGRRRPDRGRDRGAAASGPAPTRRRPRASGGGVARRGDRLPGRGRGGARLLGRGRCGRSGARSGAVRPGGPPAGCHRHGPRRRSARRAAARGLPRGARRAAECRQVHPAQPPQPTRRGDRLTGARHHPRCDRGPARSRRLAGDADRHRRTARDRRSGRGGGHPAHAPSHRRGRSRADAAAAGT